MCSSALQRDAHAGGARRRHLWAAAVLACAAGTAPAAGAGAGGYATLSYEPVALAWSAAEVERVAARQASGGIEDAARAGELGCRDLCERLQTIYDRLLPLARVQDAHAAALSWSLTVVRSAAVDALSLPGGQIIVSEAFVLRHGLDDEQLAFVIAHEMAHCVLQHERQALTFARLLLPRDVPRSVADIYTELGYNHALLKAMELVMQQGEHEADELGLLMAAASGYAPARQLVFVEHEAAQGDAPSPLVATHPPAAQRLRRLRERLPLAQRLYDAAGAGTRPIAR